ARRRCARLPVQRRDRPAAAGVVCQRPALSGRLPPPGGFRRKCRAHLVDGAEQRADPGRLPARPELRAAAALGQPGVARRQPAAYKPSAAYAMTVFDRFLPATIPDGPLLVIDPPAGSTLAGGTALGIGRVRAADAGDPLLANVDLQDVHVGRSQDLRVSTFGRPLITSLQTPLVLVHDEPFRQALFGFDLHESDLPLRIAFPIMVQNLSEWMLPPSVPSHSFHPDEPVTIVPESGATSVNVSRPDGSRRALAGAAIATFGDTDLTA